MTLSPTGSLGLHDLFSSFTGAVVIADRERRITYVNAAAEATFGYDSEELLGKPTTVLYADEEEYLRLGRERYSTEITGASGRSLVRYRHRDGAVFRGSTLGGPIRDPSGEVRGFVGIIRSASVPERAVEVLQQVQEITASSSLDFDTRVNLLLEICSEHFDLPLGIVSRIEGEDYTVTHCVDPTGGVQPGNIFPLSGTYCSLTLAADGPLGFHYASRSEHRHHPCYAAFGLEAYLGCPVVVDGAVYGTLNFSRPEASRPFNADDRALIRLIAHWLGNAIAQKRYRDELVRLATYDDLTGLLNRRVAMERLTWLRAQARRSELPLSVLLFDLDRFKRINDTLGHAAGDEVLRAVSAACSGVVRAVDHVARLGGEEFLIVLPDTPLEGAVQLHARIRGALADIDIPGLAELQRVTASFGAASLQGEESIDELLSRADDALYRAKEGGRDRVERAT